MLTTPYTIPLKDVTATNIIKLYFILIMGIGAHLEVAKTVGIGAGIRYPCPLLRRTLLVIGIIHSKYPLVGIYSEYYINVAEL